MNIFVDDIPLHMYATTRPHQANIEYLLSVFSSSKEAHFSGLIAGYYMLGAGRCGHLIGSELNLK